MSEQRRGKWSMRILGAAAVVVVLGCPPGGEERQSDTASGARDTSAVASGASLSGTTTAGAGRKTPAMDMPFDEMKNDEFAQYVKKLTFDSAAGKDRPRRCAGSGSNCRIFIKPEIGANLVGPGDKESYVIASLRAAGGGTEAKYGIRPGRTAYWLVEPDGSGSRSRMIVIDPSNNTASPLPGTYPYKDCGHTAGDLGADMQGCDSRALTPADTVNLKLELEAWVSCLPGCCTA